MNFAIKGKHMVLTHTIKLDIFGNYSIGFLRETHIEYGTHCVAGKYLLKCFCHSSFHVTISYYRTPSPVQICSDIILTLLMEKFTLQNNVKTQAKSSSSCIHRFILNICFVKT